jgi:ABC-type multidrug transport system fused ATPase/permease subunit
MSIAAIVSGFAEAAILVLIARIAFALASTHNDVQVQAGPLGSHTFTIDQLVLLAGALVILRIALQTVAVILETRVTTSVLEHQRNSLVRRYLAAGWGLQSQQSEGRLQELVTTYAAHASGAVDACASGAIAAFNLFALLLTAIFVNAVASIAAAAAALMIGLLLRPLRAALRRRSSRAALANLEYATGLTEMTSTLQEVRIFGVEPQVRARLDTLNRRSIERSLATGYVSGAIPIIYQGVAMLLMVGALGAAHAAGFSRLASLGAIILILLRSLNYAIGVQSNLQVLHQMAPYIEGLAADKERYDQSAAAHGGEPIDGIGTIEFRRVSFAYEPDVPVLREVSFQVRKGEIIGIVGPSGAGKSTLVQLLLRLREPTEGEMLVDGRDVRRVDPDAWYRHLTVVPQEPHLFEGTVADNIRFFRAGVDADALERAAKLAHLHEDIRAWPLGYDTPVGARGGQLSGGQRQRLCIARSLVEGPDMMVLDEPTSSLDVRSESLLRETLSDLAPATTVFVIAHRMSTLSICDRIMVIMNGTMQGFDRPAELEASNPFYREALKLSGLRGM